MPQAKTQRGEPPRHAGVASERAMLAFGKDEPPLQLDQRCRECAGAKREREGRVVRIHGAESYYEGLTV